jgi:hypothetical protein
MLEDVRVSFERGMRTASAGYLLTGSLAHGLTQSSRRLSTLPLAPMALIRRLRKVLALGSRSSVVAVLTLRRIPVGAVVGRTGWFFRHETPVLFVSHEDRCEITQEVGRVIVFQQWCINRQGHIVIADDIAHTVTGDGRAVQELDSVMIWYPPDQFAGAHHLVDDHVGGPVVEQHVGKDIQLDQAFEACIGLAPVQGSASWDFAVLFRKCLFKGGVAFEQAVVTVVFQFETFNANAIEVDRMDVCREDFRVLVLKRGRSSGFVFDPLF